jgi:hypothetical protein
MHKLFQMKSPAGALKMLDLAVERVGQAPEGTCGIAVGDLLSEIARSKEIVARLCAEGALQEGSLSEPAGSIAPRIVRSRK